ncbi:hypothetical protein [Lacticaseibacillus nasuensis]|uniref:hypothetical protein n=1 Tax=Lacticaseibacillus nasuensis TaxID=944671 RepID=UPI002246DC76|nr:hypothetical protein [Lacticaseibacillus nasuensis]MCX2455315.1 hypothetical protein [Lacticaseibacillus nasuensis]
MRTPGSIALTPALRSQRRTMIDAATLAFLQEQPAAALTFKALEQLTGLNRRALLRVVHSKAELLIAVWWTEYEKWCSALVKAMVPYNEDKIRQLLIRYIRDEPAFHHLRAALYPVILPALSARLRTDWQARFDQLSAKTGAELDAGVTWLVPGDGIGLVAVIEGALAAEQTRITFINVGDPPPDVHLEWVTRFVLAALAGLQSQAPRRKTAAAKHRLSKWGSATP